MDIAAHKKLLREQFANQARLYEGTVKFRHTENVVPMIELAAPNKTDRVLDVATGTGFAAFRFAPLVKSVVGVDLVPEMVQLAKKYSSTTGVANVEFALGDAEELRFPPGSFEIVLCRLTFHHFSQPEKALGEMKRVLAPGGRVILYDFLAHADPERARLHNEIELARDTSHVRVYSISEFKAFFAKAGLAEKGHVVTLMKRDFDSWMAFVGADEARKAKTRRLMKDSIEGDTSGLFVRERGDKLTFSHTCVCWQLEPAK
jgi:ubiquinone/menaquinone biosynthesis C-methylase UbiE